MVIRQRISREEAVDEMVGVLTHPNIFGNFGYTNGSHSFYYKFDSTRLEKLQTIANRINWSDLAGRPLKLGPPPNAASGAPKTHEEALRRTAWWMSASLVYAGEDTILQQPEAVTFLSGLDRSPEYKFGPGSFYAVPSEGFKFPDSHVVGQFVISSSWPWQVDRSSHELRLQPLFLANATLMTPVEYDEPLMEASTHFYEQWLAAPRSALKVRLTKQ